VLTTNLPLAALLLYIRGALRGVLRLALVHQVGLALPVVLRLALLTHRVLAHLHTEYFLIKYLRGGGRGGYTQAKGDGELRGQRCRDGNRGRSQRVGWETFENVAN
jgi:hypothetical protein